MSKSIVLIALLSCVPYYFKYEKRRPQTRETVVLAVMITLTVTGRLIFAITPSFKPVAAIVIICGMAFGSESGFVCGSMAAFLSNFFFGQGPWTPFQMVATGLIGALAGLCNKKGWLARYRPLQIFFGIAAGIFYSMVMDIWTSIGYGDAFLWGRYIATCITSIPTTIIYCVSNVVFLLVLTPVFMKKLTRVKYKYGFYKDIEEIKR